MVQSWYFNRTHSSCCTAPTVGSQTFTDGRLYLQPVHHNGPTWIPLCFPPECNPLFPVAVVSIHEVGLRSRNSLRPFSQKSSSYTTYLRCRETSTDRRAAALWDSHVVTYWHSGWGGSLLRENLTWKSLQSHSEVIAVHRFRLLGGSLKFWYCVSYSVQIYKSGVQRV